MQRNRVAISSSSRLSADAGRHVAEAGGNAVDAAIAASLTQLVTEPGVVSLAAGAFIVIWPVGDRPISIDAASEMPGRNASPDLFGRNAREVLLPYGGGTPTGVGYASVATPGALAGYDLAARRYGRVPWKDLVEPSLHHVKNGFPLPTAAHRYIETTHDGIFGWNPDSMHALQDEHGRLKQPGDLIFVEDLDQSLAAIAEHGIEVFYGGDIARMIAEDVKSHGGLLDLADLQAYRARIAPALDVALDDWHLATAPSPSVGGAALAAMLLKMRQSPHRHWTVEMAADVIDVQTEVMGFRRRRLDIADSLDDEVRELLRLAATGGANALASPSTVHASAVDSSGLACSITASAGYGSGVMPPGTGIWMNNSLGEVELNKRGFHALPPGARIPSNMAPTTGRSSDGAMLSIGSPGADRITTAILQTVLNFVHLDMPLQEAIDHPRLHVEWPGKDEPRVAYEPGIPVDRVDVPQRRFDKPDMFFGGVSAVYMTPPDHFELAADTRRTGGTALSGADQ